MILFVILFYAEYATGPKRKSSEETSMTSSERNGPAHSNDGDEHDIYEDVPHGTKGMLYPNHEEDNDEHYNYPVENMTNNSTIPTQTQVTGANSSTGGGGGKGNHQSTSNYCFDLVIDQSIELVHIVGQGGRQANASKIPMPLMMTFLTSLVMMNIIFLIIFFQLDLVLKVPCQNLGGIMTLCL